MEVKSGYKQTEIGIVPKDWEVKSISQFTNPVRGGSPRPAGDLRFFNGDFIPWLTVAALTNIPISQIYVSETETFLTEAGSHLSRNLEKETLIIANSGATLGVAKLLAIKCCANDGIAALLDFDKNVSKLYVVYYINTKIKYLREVVATGNGQPNLNTELIGLFKVPLPPTLKEQTAIATALSDTDAWINSLEQLLTKKRQIKQGAMQELLQPKEGWEVKKLGDLITYKNGKSFESEIVENGNYLLITLNSINIKGKLKPEHLKVNSFDNSLEKGDLIMVLSDVAHGNFLGLTDIIPKDNKYVLNQRMGALKNLKDVTSEYLSYYINKNQKYFKMAGKGSSQQNLGKDDILNCPIILPKTKEEQTRIATILSDMDEEIGQLESKLEKAKQLKQGMMQELLTGKTRLV